MRYLILVLFLLTGCVDSSRINNDYFMVAQELCSTNDGLDYVEVGHAVYESRCGNDERWCYRSYATIHCKNNAIFEVASEWPRGY